MAAIIYRIATGDVDGKQVKICADYGNFTDVDRNEWFVDYVGYCANAQYIKGTSPTTFNPYDSVIGYEALAMILRVVGYDKNGEFTGPTWQTTVASLSKNLGITNNVKNANFETTLTMSARRDVVADLLFQTAVSVPTVTYTPALSYSDKGSLLSEGKNPTLGQKTFGLFCEGQWKEVDKWGRPGYYWAQGGEHLFSRNSAGSLDNWAVMVDTYLAKVTGVTAPVLDKAGHVIVPAKLNLDVYDGPMSYTGANSGIGTNNPLGASAVLGQGKFPSKHVAEQNDPYEWSVGDMLLVQGYTDYNDQMTLFLDRAKTDTNVTWAWYFDTKGNLIGIDEAPSNIQHGAVTSIYSAFNQGDSYHAGKTGAASTLHGEIRLDRLHLRPGPPDALLLDVLLVALAQQGHHIAGPGQLQHPEDGGAAVGDHLVGEVPQGGGDLAADVLRALRAGVVGGDHGVVRPPGGGAGHVGAAQLGAVAPRAEHGEDPAGVVLRQGGQQGVEAGAVVGVVHDHLEGGGDGDALGPARHAHVGQPRPHRAVIEPQGAAEGHGGQGVQAVEPPGQGDVVAGRARRGEAEGQGAVGVGLDGQGAHVRRRVEAEGGGGSALGELGGHGGPGGIVHVAYRPAALAEEGGFAGAVLLQVGVLAGADVVRGQVQEHSGVEGEAVQALELHGLGGCLQHHIGAPGVGHLPQGPVEGDGLGGGVGAVGQLFPPDVRPQGADHAGLVPGGGQDVPDHVGGGGLALCAGDGDEGQIVPGAAVELGGQQGQGGPGIVHGGAGDALGQGRGAHHGGGAPIQGLGDVGAAVGAVAGQGGEQGAGGRLPGVAGELADLGILGAGPAQGGQQLGQLHGETSYGVFPNL